MAAKMTPISKEEFKGKKLSELFETITCSRCGGSGRYSFNLLDGDRCYGCGGSGLKYTKRGARQLTAYKQSQKRAVSTLKVGDEIILGGAGTRWHRISEIKQHDAKNVDIIFPSGCYRLENDYEIRTAQTFDECYDNYVKALSA